MSTRVQYRRGTTVEHASLALAVGELTVDTTKKTVVVHDGSTAGGLPLPTLTGAETLTNKTLTTPLISVINEASAGVGVTADGVLHKDGGVDISGALALSGQIAFPASQNASAGANTLDDYEEGSWTPVLEGASTAGTQTYSTQVGRYTKIGNLCFVQCNITLSAFDAATSGNMRVNGLPFTVNSVSGGSPVVGAQLSNIDLDVASGRYSPGCGFQQGQTYINLSEQGDNVSTAALTHADFANNSIVNLAGCFRV